MGKRSTKKKARRKAPSAGDGVAAARDKIARGRTKGALEDANRLAKEAPGPERDALLGEAYAARIDALAGAGLGDEARALLDVARQRLPDLAGQWGATSTGLMLRAGDLSAVLAEWGRAETPAARRQQLAGLIEAHAIDLLRIAEAPELSAEDPLRRAAGALHRAFVDAAEGSLSRAAREGLRALPRRSPLRAWRSLTLAIAAFHERDDDSVRALVGRVPEGASVRPLADLLLRCVNGRAAGDLGPAARGLLERLWGAVQRERDELDQLTAALARDEENAAQIVAARLLGRLVATDRRLALRFARWMARELDLDDEIMGPLRCALGDDWVRILALDSDPEDPDVAISWLVWLGPDPGKPLRRLDDVEMALVVDRIASGVDDLIEDLARLLRMMRLGEYVSDLSSREAAASFSSALAMVLDEGDGEAVVPLMVAHLIHELRRRLRPFPVAWASPGPRLLQIASELDPTPERFRAVLARAHRLRPRERKQLLERWAERLPDDVEPLLLLVEHAERRAAHRQAEGYLERAERVAPIDERVRAARFRVLLARLHAHLRLAKPHLCAQDLEQLEATPAAASAERTLYLTAARCRVAELLARGQAAARRELEAACGDSVRAGAMLRLVTALSDGRGGIAARDIPRGARAVPVVLQLLAVLRAVAPGVGIVKPGEWLAECTAADLPSDLEELALLCSALNRIEDADLLHLCSGLGLRRDGALLPRFVMYRWLALRTDRRWTEHAEAVRRLALGLAYRYQDREVVRELLKAVSFTYVSVRDDPEPMGEAEIAALLGHERGLQGTLAERGGRRGPARTERKPKPRQRGAKSRRKRRDLTQLLPFASVAAEDGAEAGE